MLETSNECVDVLNYTLIDKLLRIVLKGCVLLVNLKFLIRHRTIKIGVAHSCEVVEKQRKGLQLGNRVDRRVVHHWREIVLGHHESAVSTSVPSTSHMIRGAYFIAEIKLRVGNYRVLRIDISHRCVGLI